MNESFEAGGPFRRVRSERAILIIVAMAFTAIAVNDGVHSWTHAGESRHRLKPFVLLLRQGPTALSESERKARTDAIVAWAQRQNDAGHRLDSRSLGEERQWIGSENPQVGAGAGSADGALSDILFLQARNLEEATGIARSYPGLRDGASVEVRPWSSSAGPS